MFLSISGLVLWIKSETIRIVLDALGYSLDLIVIITTGIFNVSGPKAGGQPFCFSSKAPIDAKTAWPE